MLYGSGKEYLAASKRSILLFGMSGLGKTRLSSILRGTGRWFHYSVDYRIGTRYMGEHIADNFKREAMKVPLLRELLMTDSVYIASNITFDNLAPLSTYLGKPGSPEKHGLPFDEYMRRQEQHRQGEVAALLDTERFIKRAHDIYGYKSFVCDSGGSICEIVDPDNPDDPVLKVLSDNLLMVWIEGAEAHTADLIQRFDRAPKPMYYRPDFLNRMWQAWLDETGNAPDKVDPDAFVRYTYAHALAHRQPLYAAMAQNWGVRVTADEVARVNNEHDYDELIAEALDRRNAQA